MKTDSAARGGAIIMLARVIGMGCAFLLFLLLARHSEVEAGVFRTVVTFMIISEFLGLLGTQRWLAVEVAAEGQRRWQLFLAGCLLSVLTASCIALIYLGISFSDVYGPEISRGLQFAVLSTIPAALLTNVQTVLVGVGMSQRMGMLNLVENVTRSLLSIGCVLAGLHVLTIIAIFVLCRWLITLAGMVMVVRALRHGDAFQPPRGVIRELMQQVPRFALIMGSFLLMRNAALLLLPALVNEREVALFAVPYQIYDLALLVPSILALSTNYLFARQALRGPGALRWVVTQLWSVTSVFLLPLIMLALIFGSDLLHAVFGQRYDASLPAFYLLMLNVPLMALDQVLSQTMQSSKRFRQDAISVVMGAALVLAGTLLFGKSHGATGAAGTLLVAVVCILLVRMVQLHGLIRPLFLLRLVQRPLLVCMMLGGVLWTVRHYLFYGQGMPLVEQWGWLPASIAALPLYVLLLRKLGGLSQAKRARIRKFLFIRHEGGAHAS